MTDEMKLLMALCDALGFKVEKDIKYTPVADQIALNEKLFFGQPSRFIKIHGKWHQNDPIISYKLTKKAP